MKYAAVSSVTTKYNQECFCTPMLQIITTGIQTFSKAKQKVSVKKGLSADSSELVLVNNCGKNWVGWEKTLAVSLAN